MEHAEVGRLHDRLADRDAVFLTIAPKARGADYRDVYLAGAGNLLAALAGTSVRRVVYTSSTRVYGQKDGSWVDESGPTDPGDQNGRALLETERTLLDGVAELGGRCAITATVVRLAGIYGSGRDAVSRIRAAAGTQRGDGDAYVNMIHVEDVVAALIGLLDSEYGGVLNLADDRPEPRRTYYDRVLAREGLPPIQWTSPRTSAGFGKRIRNDAIKRAIGLVLQHPTHDA